MKNTLVACVVFLFSFGWYLLTLTPTIMPSDSAELTTCAWLLSISHAPGYPLYLLLGKIFTSLPLGEIAFRMNLMSAFFGALACMFVFLIVETVLSTASSQLIQKSPALIAASCLCFSCSFWELCTRAEVYTLDAFLTSALILLLLVWRKNKNTNLLYLFFLLYGLSLGNHITIVLFLPAFCYFIIKSHRLYLGEIFFLALFFLLGLCIYLYLPLRSFSDVQIVNWDKITTLQQFFSFVSGGHFKNKLFSMPAIEVIRRLKEFLLFLLIQFPVFGFSIGLFGIIQGFRAQVASYKMNKDINFLFLFMSVSLLFFCINYNIADIANFYLPIYLIFVVWIGIGVSLLINAGYKTQGTRHKVTIIGVISLLLFFSYKLTYGWLEINTEQRYCFEANNLCRESLRLMSPKSLLISNWKYATCFWYWQKVLKVREDVEVLSQSNKKKWKTIVSERIKYQPVYLIKNCRDRSCTCS